MDEQSNSTKGAPMGVKIISIVYGILGFFHLIAAILLLFGAAVLSSVFVKDMFLFSWLGVGFLGILIFILFILGILMLFIARGLWKLKNWARITAIILSVLGLLEFNLFSILISLIIGGYLLLSQEVKTAFNGN